MQIATVSQRFIAWSLLNSTYRYVASIQRSYDWLSLEKLSKERVKCVIKVTGDAFMLNKILTSSIKVDYQVSTSICVIWSSWITVAARTHAHLIIGTCILYGWYHYQSENPLWWELSSLCFVLPSVDTFVKMILYSTVLVVHVWHVTLVVTIVYGSSPW